MKMKSKVNKKKGVKANISKISSNSPDPTGGLKKKTKSGISSRLVSVMKSMSQNPSEDIDDTKEVSESKEMAEAMYIKKSKSKELIGSPSNIENRTESSVKTTKQFDTESSVRKTKQFDKEQNERTIFVGNVNVKCGKRKLLSFFAKYGNVEAVRLRSVAPAQPEVSKKEAAVKHNIHPSRSTCNAYVRFKTKDMMEAALEANGQVLLDNHLRVDRSVRQNNQDRHCAVFVGNLPFECEDESLYKHFEDCGEIASVRIIRDAKFSSGKGFGYVNFKSSDAVEVALQLNGKHFMKRNLRIQRCVKKVKKSKKKVEDTPHEGQNIGFMKLKPQSKMSLKFMKKQKKNITKGSIPDRKNNHKNKPGNKSHAGTFSGKKMMENKQFKKMKKSRQSLNKEEKKKVFISRHLTGTKPMKKKR